MNQMRTFFFLIGIPLLMILIGDMLAHEIGVFIALLFTVFMYFTAFFADNTVLNLYKAQKANLDDYPVLKNTITTLTQKAQLPTPTLYIIQDDAPNAFAIGRNKNSAGLAITSGLISTLNQDELSALISHELYHIQNQDTLIATISAAVAGFFTGLANTAAWKKFLDEKTKFEDKINPTLMRILAPITSLLISISISPDKEFKADAEGAKLCGNAMALASALQKIDASKTEKPFNKAQTLPATAHLFFVNPLNDPQLLSWFHRQPPTAERIQRLSTTK